MNGTVLHSEGGTRAPPVMNVDVENAFGAALNIGVAVELTPNRLSNFDVKTFFLHPDVSVSTSVGPISASTRLDPWVIGAGIRYRF